MHRTAAALLVLLLGAGRSRGRAGQPEPSDAAMAFVDEFADDHLSGMLSRIGGQSEALRTLSQIDARLLAAAFDAEIDAAVERHGDAWARNLAMAWSPFLTDAQMASLAEEGAASPYADSYVENRGAAAARMAELSQDLFERILQEVVAATLTVLAPEQPAK